MAYAPTFRALMLEKRLDGLSQLADRYREERVALAKLAAEGPCFLNPLHARETKKLRDQILRECGLNPDGTPITAGGAG